MENINQQYRKIMNDPQERENVFKYHYNKGFFENQKEYEARTKFEGLMQDGNNLTTKMLICTYLPEYSRATERKRIDKYRKDRIGAAKTIAATGLLAILLSFGAQKEFQRKFIRGLGLASVLAAGIGGAIVNERRRRNE